MFLNSLHICLFIITKQVAKITVFFFYFSQMTFREIARLNSIDPLYFWNEEFTCHKKIHLFYNIIISLLE